MKKVILYNLVAFISLLNSCDNESADRSNSAPNIQLIMADPPSLKGNESTMLTCVANDPDGDNLTYTWSADKGFFTNGNSDSTITWTAPNETGSFVIRVTVNDGKLTDQKEDSILVFEDGANACDSTVTHTEKIYNTIQIGEQCWLKENLNIGTMILRNSINDNQTDNNSIEKFCFDNDEMNCDANGGLYQWNEAMQYITTEGAQGLCPTGWHVPTKSDFDILINTVGGSGNALKALGQGTGTNTSGFTALLAGHRDHNDGLSHAQGDDAIFWGSSENNDEGNSIDLYRNSNSIFSSNYHKEHGFSIRCVKD